jgi:hypothetical integral membrane protein (TIGR02206 family)
MVPLTAAERFVAFSGEHYTLLAVFAVGLVLVARWGRAHRGTARELHARRSFAVCVAVLGVGMQAYQLTPGDFSLKTSLPLQLCDMATVAAVVALWSRSARAAAFTYYVGLTLTIQGIITPSLAEAFPHPRFFGFWLLHFAVVWAAAYLTWGLGLRPDWRLYRWSAAATALWAGCVLAFNSVTGTNYGYLNRKPASASALDLLGPWPWYVVAEVAFVLVVWAVVLTLPWRPGRPDERADERADEPSAPAAGLT